MILISLSKILIPYQARKDKYDTAAHKLVASCLIIRNSLSSRTYTYFKDQCVLNQSNYSDTVIAVFVMITSFVLDIDNGGNKTTDGNTDEM